MFKQILVPLDGSPRAELALPVAARIARNSGSPVILVQVINLPIYYEGLAPAPLVTDEVIEAEFDDATAYLKKVAASPILAGIATSTEVMFGLPAQEILALAESQEADLIVISSHGETGFIGLVLGNVAYTLIHTSPIPVLMLRNESEEHSLQPRSDSTQLPCALVALDGSRAGEAALVPAAYLIAALAAPQQAELHLVQVVRVSSLAINERNEEAFERASKYLAQVEDRLRTTLKNLNLLITASVEPGTDVAETLIDIAEHGEKGAGAKNAQGVQDTGDNGGCNLLALSAHGQGMLKRLAMGDVTKRILKSTTRLPLLIVQPKKEEAHSEPHE